MAEYNRLTAQDLWLRNLLSTTRSAVCALEAAQRFELELQAQTREREGVIRSDTGAGTRTK